jgi:hypothetical protein
MKSRSKIHFPRPEIPLLNGRGEPPLTFDQIIEKWAGVFEPEFWDEVRKAPRCDCHARLKNENAR